MGKNNKTEVAKVYLTPKEKNLWREKATLSGLSLSDFIRDAVEEKKIICPDVLEQLKEITNQINRIGINLNQLTKIANTYPSQVKPQDLTSKIEQFRSKLDEINDDLTSQVENNAD